MKECSGYIGKIETLTCVDGPGVRVVLFLNGCNLRCIYCHNPELWHCNKNKVTSDEIINKIIRYKEYMGTNGGVTFSGGEPLVQHDFLLDLIKKCKNEHINVAIETSGSGNYQDIIELVDLVIIDVKATTNEEYKDITNGNWNNFIAFLNHCQTLNKKLWIRQVIIPSINDNTTSILKLKQFISNIQNIEKVELLPYHTMGISKYESLGLNYKLKDIPSMDKQKCLELEQLLKTE